MSSGSPSLDRSPNEPNTSSPVGRYNKVYAQHKRDEFHKFGYDDAIHEPQAFESAEDFLAFLGVPQDHLTAPSTGKPTFSNFIKLANTIAKSLHRSRFPNKEALVFQTSGSISHHAHVTGTDCRPDIVAAFTPHWIQNATLWPCIRLAGEAPSKGKPPVHQKIQAISYLHHLLLARPDLHVAQGLLTTERHITFLLGIGGVGIRSFDVLWTNKEIDRLINAFIYRLYDPGFFADSAYELIIPDLERKLVTYTLRIAVEGKGFIECPDFLPVYATSPFGTRTHVLSNPASGVKVGGKPLTVIKDQLCNRGTRFNEHLILDAIHAKGTVPGVVEMVYKATVDGPPFIAEFRQKYRTGLRQIGSPFMSIPTPQKVLEIVFDLLEVLRFLRTELRILHRDISQGNVLYIEDAEPSATPESESVGMSQKDIPREDLCFIKYLLSKSDDPQKTSVLLIDFNHSENLESKRDTLYKRMPRTGTRVFIARAVEMGEAVPLPARGSSSLASIPPCPPSYASAHPDRVRQFPTEGPGTIYKVSADSKGRVWRQELEHDAESVFWLLCFWVITAQPKDRTTEEISPAAWINLTSDDQRGAFLHILLSSPRSGAAVHSVYDPLWPLLGDLAHILTVDRYWLEETDKRNHCTYVGEAFQRLILDFLNKHDGEAFMIHPIAEQRRQPARTSSSVSPSTPKRSMEVTRSRLLPFPIKRPRLNAPSEATSEAPGPSKTRSGWSFRGR